MISLDNFTDNCMHFACNFFIFDYMKPVKYDKLYEELLEEYPVQDNPEIYSLYTSMLNHLMKIFKLKHSTAVKLLLKIEEKLGIRLVRDREMTNMKMINVTKGNDVKRYFRILYWTTKIPLETVDTIIKIHGDVNCRLVKEFLKQNGEMSENKYNEFTYAQNYYREHREELKEKKRLYRQRKKKEKEND